MVETVKKMADNKQNWITEIVTKTLYAANITM